MMTRLRLPYRFIMLSVAFVLSAPSLQGQTGFGPWNVMPGAPQVGNRFEDVFFVDRQHGWAITLEGDIFRTTDGLSWEHSKLLDAEGKDIRGFRSLGFHDAMHGWIGSLDPGHLLFETTDGGVTWSQVTNIPEPAPKGICGIWIVNDDLLYGVGRFDGPARLLKTIDRGKNWEVIDLSGYASALVDCRFFGPDSGFVVGNVNGDFKKGNAVALFTADGGKSWERRYLSPRIGELCWKIHFRTRADGYVALECAQGQRYYLKTTDGGATWTDHLYATDNLGGGFAQGMIFTSEMNGWISGYGQRVYQTTDGGVTWSLIELPQYISLNRFRKLNDSFYYVGGSAIYTYSPGVASGVGSDPRAAREPSVEIMPNPAASSVRIRTTDAETIRHVVILNDRGDSFRQSTASGEAIDLDVSDLAQGVYFVRVSCRSGTIVKPLMIVR